MARLGARASAAGRIRFGRACSRVRPILHGASFRTRRLFSPMDERRRTSRVQRRAVPLVPPRQLGYKSVKFITRLTVTSLKGFGKGVGSATPEGGYAWYVGI
jgi:hypothetical protein